MTLSQAIAQMKLVKDALLAGKIFTAIKLAVPVVDWFADVGMSFGLQGVRENFDSAQVAELKCLIEECVTAAEQLQAPGVASVETAAWGDGVLLGRLIELFKLLLPIFAPIFLDKP